MFSYIYGAVMAKLLLVVMFVLCSACQQLNVPAARIEFTSIEYSSSSYHLRVRSDRDLVSLYEAHGVRAQVNSRLTCSLDGDGDFYYPHHIRYTAEGLIDDVRIVEGDRRYEFDVDIRFQENSDEGTTTNSIRKEVLLSLLKSQEYVPCQTTTTAYFYKGYYSKIMYVPTSRILAEVKKEFPVPDSVIVPAEERQLSWLYPEQICVTKKGYFGGESILHGGVCSRMPYSGLLSSFAPYNGKLRIVDSKTAQPKADIKYIIQYPDGREDAGISDAQGDTHLLGWDHYEELNILVYEDGLEAFRR